MSLLLDVDGRRDEVDAQAETALLYGLRNDLSATVSRCQVPGAGLLISSRW